MAGFGTQPFGSSAFGGTNPGGAVASRVLARDTIVSRKRVGRAVTSRATAADTLTVRHRAVRSLATSPKVRDTVTGTVRARAGAAVASTVAVRDTVSAGTPRTRLYLPSSGAAAVSPAYDAEWDDTTNAATRLRAVATKGATAITMVSAAETGGSTALSRDLLVRQYVSDPVAAQTITGTFKAQVQAREPDLLANFVGQVVIRVVSGDGTTVRGTLYAGDIRADTFGEWATARRSQRIPATGQGPLKAVTPVTTLPGDRVVVELGARAQNTSAVNYTAEMWFGDAATGDLATGGTETGDLNPWLELSHVFAWLQDGTVNSRVTVADTAMGATTRAGSAVDAVTVADVVTGRALRARNVTSTVKVFDVAGVKKRGRGTTATAPKVRDTATGRSDRAGSVTSSPKVRDTATGRSDRAGSVTSSPKVRDTATGRRRTGATAADVVTVADVVTGRSRRSGAGPSVWVTPSELAAQPMTGANWASLLAIAEASLGSPDVSDQDSTHDSKTMAVALAAARTGRSDLRTKAIDALTATIGTEGNTRWLAVGRNLGAYIISADVLDIRTGPIYDWLASFATRLLPHNNTGVPITLAQTAWSSGSNASAQEGFVEIALAVYLGDQAMMDASWVKYRRYAGDRTSPHVLVSSSDAWQEIPAEPVGVQNLGATNGGCRLDGAISNDMARGGDSVCSPVWTQYPWVGMDGFAPAAEVFANAGYPAHTLSDSALRRAMEYLLFLSQSDVLWFDGTRGSVNAQLANHVYGTSFPVNHPVGAQRCVGFTDWSHPDGAFAADTVAVADTVTTKKRGQGTVTSTVLVLAFELADPASTRESPAITDGVTVADTATGAPRGARDVLTRVKVSDAAAGSADIGSDVTSTVAVSGAVAGSGRARVGGDVTSRVAVGDTIVVAAEFYRDITATATLLTTETYRGSVEFVNVAVAADVELDSQPVHFQVARYRARASSSGRRVVTLNSALWEPAEWAGTPGTERVARLLYDPAGRGVRAGQYAVHVRLRDNPEVLVFVNAGVLRVY